ncbi:hypothetical protein DFP96_10457 [Listeria rocourtiae]|uniref:Uncharacterized protein n=1 Tax=Listeria rocourtiae TaxID=647910 RepID=A0A4R6ZLZ0_9LIST|nr:hypothetical protein DFP96_10457 [Listeria rocourtiae]
MKTKNIIASIVLVFVLVILLILKIWQTDQTIQIQTVTKIQIMRG